MLNNSSEGLRVDWLLVARCQGPNQTVGHGERSYIHIYIYICMYMVSTKFSISEKDASFGWETL